MKHLTGFLSLFLFAVLPLSAADLSDLTYTTTGAEVTITDCDTDATGELVIPGTIGGNPVTSIGERAFYQCRSLTGITIPDSVTSIGLEAFYECILLTSITIPDSVTSIGRNAFWRCNRLTSITIPDSVTSIGESAFFGCSSLTSIAIPDSVTRIGDYAFVHCTSLRSIAIPAAVEVIRNGVFDNCTSLTKLIFLGDAPEDKTGLINTFPTIYRKPESKGWDDKWSRRPVELICEKP